MRKPAADMTPEEAVATGMSIARWAALRPDKAALLSPSGNRTWAELNARVNQVARAYQRAGLKSGDAVALLAHNSPEFVEAWAATQRVGLRVTAVNWHSSAEIIAYVVDNCDARVIISSARFAAAASAAAQLSRQLVLKLAYAGAIEGFEDYETVIGLEDQSDIDEPEVGSTMLYTSGTTGRPKGVYRRTRPVVSQLTAVANATAKWNPESDLSLLTGPLYHAAPLGLNLVLPINAGAASLLMDKWDAEETLRLIDRHRVTHTHLVPTMMHRMLQLPQETRDKYDISSMRWIIHGAAPCPAHVKQGMIDWFGPGLYEYYSATEGGGVWVTSDEWVRKPGTVGRAVPGVEVKLLNIDGTPTPQGQDGLIYTRAPVTGAFEYYKEPGKTTASYRDDWFTLGDVGRFDAEGFLFLTGRTAELIISGGVNIYPVEIDEVLIRHPLIADAAVIGVPNEDWGEEIKAVVELRPGATPDAATAEAILDFARACLPGFQRPRTVDFVDTLPRSPAGKVLRAQVRAPYWAGRNKSI
jgi:long-chain acyl-CoA synthetase